jgi:hypothetical protein
MRRMRIRRPSASLVISCLALFVALGGAAYAGTQLKKNSVGTSQIKKNAVTTAKLKKKAVTTAKIKPGAITGNLVNEATLGTVPSATTATSATSATTATSVSSVLTFSVGANEGQLVSLAKTANFELMGFCDPKETAFPPGIEGSEKEREGTTVVIYNRSSAVAFAQSDDADNYKLELNQGISFNYDDNGDAGMAMSEGHFMAVPSYGNLVADTTYEEEPSPGDNYSFPTACHFAGAALVG